VKILETRITIADILNILASVLKHSNTLK